MSEFKNVSIVKAANVYFDGHVTSRTIKFSDGSIKTLGIMLPGEYLFNTDAQELMEVISGSMAYQLAGSADWITVQSGSSFKVPASSSFNVKTEEITDYCCSFV
jgi:uncharacterized protein YaiE (UPF0345 family)